MYIVMGATGHVGGSVARTLLQAGERVTAISRDAKRADPLRKLGAEVAELDVNDVDALRAAFKRGKRAFLLNPPAPTDRDTDKEERASVRAILSALTGSGLEKLVAQSTYGAQPGECIGDLSVLYELEQGLKAQAIPTTITRGAYYYSNFDQLVEPARDGMLPTMLPADLTLPMVAPDDLGVVAAKALQAPVHEARVLHVEGPVRATFADVARAFAKALARTVELAVTPRDEWESAFEKLGFSQPAAHSFARMMAATVEGPALPEDPVRGTTTLEDYVDALVKSHSK